MKYAFINGIILDGTRNMKPRYHQAILTYDDRIESITDENSSSFQDYEVINLHGNYIMPGLINMSSSFGFDGKSRTSRLLSLPEFMKVNKIKKTYKKELLKQLYSGVTTVLSMGSYQNMDRVMNSYIDKELMDGPRVIAANQPIGFKESYLSELCMMVNNDEEAGDAVSQSYTNKNDIVSIMATGDIFHHYQMSGSLLSSIISEAHRLSLKTAVYASNQEMMKTALKCHADYLYMGISPDVETIDLFKQSNTVLISGLSPLINDYLLDADKTRLNKEDRHKAKTILQGAISCLEACMLEEIPVGIGSGIGFYVTHYDFWRELIHFKNFCHVSNKFALYCATYNNAKLLGLGSVTGSLSSGKYADMIVTRENPLDHLDALKDPVMTISKGRVYKDITINKNIQIEKALDRIIDKL
ncbi:amidohydrolase family protein [Eggerthia catenaformis]|uniref:amidohydrolase family protein n=1 Tax=Eggerthia catenaformis TaxID=31973 RepID=UPI0028EE2B36|nr:amidohydrolase family protein [Eggerthia catenaformis]